MPDLIIRRAGQADVSAISALAREAYAPYVPLIGREPAPMVADFSALASAGRVDVLLASRICGYAVHYSTGGGRWHLENIAIDPATQGRGIGRYLIAHVEATARRAGAAMIDLYTNALMSGNLTLYRRLGYLEVSRGEQDGFDRVFFEKPL